MRWLPYQASSNAEELDQLYFFLVGTSAFFTALICVLILFFAVRYRRGRAIDRSHPSTGSLKLELAWSIVPLVIMLFSFAWGAKLYISYFRPPADAMEIFVVGKQWMWRIQHTEGRSEINQLHVPLGQPIRLRMISEDVIHSFFIPDFRVKKDVLPGRYTNMWFTATRLGEYHLFCAEYCGTSHSQMRGKVIVQTPEEYTQWLAEQSSEAPAIVGQRLFERYRCASCHKQKDMEKGPTLHGLFGRLVNLEGGGQVTADLSYFRRSLHAPAAHVVSGYLPLMPTYKPGQVPPEAALTEEQILQLAAYVRSLPAPTQ